MSPWASDDRRPLVYGLPLGDAKTQAEMMEMIHQHREDLQEHDRRRAEGSPLANHSDDTQVLVRLSYGRVTELWPEMLVGDEMFAKRLGPLEPIWRWPDPFTHYPSSQDEGSWT